MDYDWISYDWGDNVKTKHLQPDNLYIKLNTKTLEYTVVSLSKEEVKEHKYKLKRHKEIKSFINRMNHASNVTKEITHKAHNKLNRKFKIRKNPKYTLSKLKNRFKHIFSMYDYHIRDLRKKDINCPLYYSAELCCTYLLDMMKKINNDIKCIKNRFNINPNELAMETFKPSRIFYQMSLDPEYLDN